MSEPLAASLTEALEPLLRRLVDEAIERRADEWRWLSAKQAGELLDMSPAAVRQRVQRGQFPGRNVSGRVYVDMRALDREIDQLPCPATSVKMPRRRARPGARP